MSKLSHFNEQGGAHMVDISAKNDTSRIAVATGRIRMQPETAEIIRSGTAQKGDVLGVAQVAAIMAAKNTSQMIPMCHPLMLTGTDVAFDVTETTVEITATIKTTGKTGVEMEALSAVSVAALTIYDMVKAVDKQMVIEDIKVTSKSGGASGDWERPANDANLCDDGSCAIDFGREPVEINIGGLAGLGVAKSPTEPDKSGGDS